MGVAISSREQLAAWIDSKPHQWGPAIALRCAMRVLPFALDPQSYRSGVADRSLTKAVFRAILSSSGGAKTPPDDKSAARAALAARTAAARAANAFATADASASASNATYSYAAAYATHAHDAAAAAAAAAGSAARAARAAVWQSVADDCSMLERGDTIAALLAAPLWSDGLPGWLRSNWIRGSTWLVASPDGFALWRDWYVRKLRGKRFEFDGFDQAAEREFFIRLFANDDDWWNREPAAVNADIAGWVAELGSRHGADEPAPDSSPTDTTSPLQQDPISPEQVREILQKIASPQAVIANGQISFHANAEFETPLGDLEAWHPRHLLDIIDVLRLGLRDNAPNPLKVGLAKYHEVLARDPDLPVITTLQACIGVVRTTFQSDDHEIWADGLEEPFDALFRGHKRLLNDYPNLQERRRLRDQITPTPVARKVDGLNADIARFADIAAQLKELGVTDETAHAYLQSIVDIGRQIAIGFGTDAPASDDTDYWTPPAQIRADMSGVMARIESQLSLLLSITGHPNVQAALVAIAPEVARLLTFFG